MKLKSETTIKGGIIETTVSIDGFGSAELSAEDEKELFEDYKITIDYGKLLFSRPVGIDEHKNPYIIKNTETEPTTDPDDPSQEPVEETPQDIVILKMPIGERYELNSDFELKYAVDIEDLGDDYKYYNNIADNICLAKAMCLVFENVVIDYIQEQFEIAKKHKDDFESIRYYTI